MMLIASWSFTIIHQIFTLLNIYSVTLGEIELDLLDNAFKDQYHITFSLIILYISSVCYMALHDLAFPCTANPAWYV